MVNHISSTITKQSNSRTSTKNTKIKFSYFTLRLKELFLQKTILFGIPFLLVINLLFGIVYSTSVFASLSWVTITDVYSYWLIGFSLINFVLITFAVWKLFHLDNIDGQIQLELRSGFSKWFMFGYRLLLIICLIAIIILSEVSINSIFYAVNRHKDSYYAYRLFISPFLWLFFISLLSLTLSLFFTVVIRTKMAIAFSLILGFICLIGASLGAHWTSIKADRNTNPNMMIKDRKTEYAGNSGIRFFNLNAENYFAYGIEYQNNSMLFEALKLYQEYDFLADDALEKLGDSDFANQYTFYRELVRIGDIYDQNTSKNQIIPELKNSSDSLLNAYAQFLTQKETIGHVVKFDNPNKLWLFSLFQGHVLESRSFYQDGFTPNYEEKVYLNQWLNFNKKLNQAKNINPLYQINLLFFGYHPNFIQDNLTNFNRPLFAQGLNTKFTFNLKPTEGTFDGEETYVLEKFKAQQNIDVRWIFLGYGLGMLFLIGIMGFAYRAKR